jgi:hypothetical protein
MSTRTTQPQPSADPDRSLRRMISARKPLVGVIAALAVVTLFGAGYVIAGPPAEASAPTSAATGAPARQASVPEPATELNSDGATAVDGGVSKDLLYDQGETGRSTTPATAIDGVQIVKTGSMSLEVASIDSAVAQAQASIEGMGGYVAGSNRYGSGEEASATYTFRLPVARWDDALKAMRALGSKVLSEQTGTTDVTSQVVDLDARITNLKAAEAALQGIMAKAVEIKDILAVQEQLTQTRSQIEQLTAQVDYLKNQAAMSTLSVAFVLPAKTVTTQATTDWDFNKQVDQAAAALVRIGQGLATIAVWAVIVGLPLIGGLLILWILYRIGRRISRRSQSAA